MSALNLYAASKQWAERPSDQRFESIDELLTFTRKHRDTAAQATVKTRSLRIVEADGDNLAITGSAGKTATLTHWAFGQLCTRVGAPAEYLRSLPSEKAGDLLNYGLQQAGRDETSRILFHQNGSMIARSVTSEDYARIFNCDVVSRIADLVASDSGWRVPPARPALPNQPGTRPATEADVLQARGMGGLSINVGDPIAPAGLYASDHDMFAFLVNENCRIDNGAEGGLARGVFVSNSEVGAAALKVTGFGYEHVCGNHIVWGAKMVKELRIVHRGHNDRRFSRTFVTELRKMMDASGNREAAAIVQAKRCILGATKDEVLDNLFGRRILSRGALESAYDIAIKQADLHDSHPRSAWGFAQGMTRLSQVDHRYADRRVEVDRAAGKVLDLAF